MPPPRRERPAVHVQAAPGPDEHEARDCGHDHGRRRELRGRVRQHRELRDERDDGEAAGDDERSGQLQARHALEQEPAAPREGDEQEGKGEPGNEQRAHRTGCLMRPPLADGDDLSLRDELRRLPGTGEYTSTCTSSSGKARYTFVLLDFPRMAKPSPGAVTTTLPSPEAPFWVTAYASATGYVATVSAPSLAPTSCAGRQVADEDGAGGGHRQLRESCSPWGRPSRPGGRARRTAPRGRPPTRRTGPRGSTVALGGGTGFTAPLVSQPPDHGRIGS